MPDNDPAKATTDKILRVSEATHSRIKEVSDLTDSATIKTTHEAILKWALPSFEDGRVKLDPYAVSQHSE